MKSRIIGKYWNQRTGAWYALVYQFGLIYSLPYNLATTN